MRRALVALGLAAALGAAGYAQRAQALWLVAQACVADAQLTGSPFPCLEVTPESVVFRPFWTPDLILAPTRKLLGVEDPFLQSPQAPNYFAAAWRARAYLQGAGQEDVVLVVNPALTRSQDQLHIHIGCVHPEIRAAIDRAAPQAPTVDWAPLPPLVEHIAFWGRLVRNLDGVSPFREAAEALAGQLADRSRLTLGVAGVRVGGVPQFLLFASYAGAPHSWWPLAAENMMDTNCAKVSADSRYAPASTAPAAARP